MNRPFLGSEVESLTIPRASGDEPNKTLMNDEVLSYSPRQRG